MYGEVWAFVAGFGLGFMIASHFELRSQRRLRINMYMDCKKLFDAMIKIKQSAVGHLMAEILDSCQSYKRFEIESVAIIRKDFNAADALSKLKGNDALYKNYKKGAR